MTNPPLGPGPAIDPRTPNEAPKPLAWSTAEDAGRTLGVRRRHDEVGDAPGRTVVAQRQLHVLAAMRIGALAEEREAGADGAVRRFGRGKQRVVLAARETRA